MDMNIVFKTLIPPKSDAHFFDSRKGFLTVFHFKEEEEETKRATNGIELAGLYPSTNNTQAISVQRTN